RIEVLLQCLQVDFFEFLSVVELLAHRIAQGRILMKNLEVQLVRPPVLVRRTSAGRGFVSSARYRTLAVFIHLCSPFLSGLDLGGEDCGDEAYNEPTKTPL